MLNFNQNFGKSYLDHSHN